MKILCQLFLALFLVDVVQGAAPTFDDFEVAAVTIGNTIATSHVVGGGCANPIVIANIYWNDSTTSSLSSITTTAGAMTGISTGVTNNSGTYQQEMYKRVGATGAQTVTANFSANFVQAVLTSLSYCDVNQATSNGTAATATGLFGSPTVDVTSATGETVIDAVSILGGLTLTAAGAGQTERINDTDGVGFFEFGSSDEAGAATVTMSWTSDDSLWIIIGVGLKPVAAAATTHRHRAVVLQ